MTKSISPQVQQKLIEVLSENYDYATYVVTYAEIKSLEFNYTGMAEFRDALTHVKRAIYAENEDLALDELNSTFEHIRRAAVESMQEYIESKYTHIRKRIYLSKLKSILARYKTPDKKEITNLEAIIKENLFYGREAKPRKEWKEAIGYFKRAEDALDQLDNILPDMEELDYRYSETVQSAILLISGFIIGRILI